MYKGKTNLAGASIVMITRQFSDISFGGVEIHILNLAKQYSRLGFKVKVVRIGTVPSDSQNFEEFQFQFVEFGKSKGQSWIGGGSSGLFGELRDRLKMNFYRKSELENLLLAIADFDIVHFHDLLAISRVSRKLSQIKKVIWTNHLGEFLKISRMPFGKYLLRFLTKQFSLAFAPSAELANQDCITCPVYAVPNGFDTDKFKFTMDHGEYKDKLGLPRKTKIYLVPRRWAPTKGVGNLTKALINLENEECLFVFLGFNHAGYNKYHQSIIDDLNKWKIKFLLKESVSSNQIADWYRASDYTVIPSLEEATSLAAIEAMGCGSLVIATPIGGLIEIIEDKVTGLLSTDTSIASLRNVFIESTLLVQTDYLELVMRANKLVKEKYSWSNVADYNVSLMKKHSILI